MLQERHEGVIAPNIHLYIDPPAEQIMQTVCHNGWDQLMGPA